MGNSDDTRYAHHFDGIRDEGSPRIRNAVILPDGTKPIPMGSGMISGLLGTGGMANVYEIWNAQLEDNRAVKLLHPNYTPEQKQRFQTEMKICAKLHHPNIIEIHAVGNWNGLPFIEMERIKGHTLDHILTGRGALPLQICTAVGVLVTRALVHAHNQEYVIYGKNYHGVIHRDLKPSNIMIAGDGRVKLMDFGIARPTDASIHTTDGAILGTMQYLSPEQLDGKEADVRTDVYALGMVVYEMLTGVRAFADTNVSKLMLGKIRNNYKHLDRFAVRIPPRLRRLVHSCMAHDPARRPRSAGIFLDELSRIHRSLAPGSPEETVRRWLDLPVEGRVVVGNRPGMHFAPVFAVLSGMVLIVAIIMWWSVSRAPVSFDAESSVSGVITPAVAVTTAPSAEAGGAAPPNAGKVPSEITTPEPRHPVVQPVVPTAPATPKTGSFLDTLRIRYGVADIEAIFVKECERGAFATALQVYDSLPAQQARTTAVLLYRLRALEAAGSPDAYNRTLMETPLDDGEYFLRQARLEIAQGNLDRALALIEKSHSVPCRLLDEAQRRVDVLFLRAQCNSMVFDRAPARETMEKAMDSWFEVKAALRNRPDHQYYRTAVNEMQRLRLPTGKG